MSLGSGGLGGFGGFLGLGFRVSPYVVRCFIQGLGLWGFKGLGPTGSEFRVPQQYFFFSLRVWGLGG